MGVDNHIITTMYTSLGEQGCRKTQMCSECQYAEYSEMEPHQYVENKCTRCEFTRSCQHVRFETQKNGHYPLFPCNDDPTSCSKREKCGGCGINVVSDIQTHTFTRIRNEASKYFCCDDKTCVKKEMCHKCGLVRNAITPVNHSFENIYGFTSCKKCDFVLPEDKLPCLTCDLESNLDKFDPDLDHPSFEKGVCTACKTKCDHPRTYTMSFTRFWKNWIGDANKCGICQICLICSQTIMSDQLPHLFLDRQKDGKYERICINCGAVRAYSGNLEILEQKIEKYLEQGKQDILTQISDIFIQLK